ncbi:MAG: efflux RND transporter periplasmic adaptor subunit [Nitrospinota bacterium]|nr:efflux RND transporter periplasmic adaptor subunit [Nitrospinota bacterium]
MIRNMLFKKSWSAMGYAAVLLSMTVLLWAGCAGKEKEGENTTNKPRSTPVTIVKAVSQTVLVTQEVIGLIESKAAPFVSAEAAGRVKEIFVDVGQQVTLGQPLAQLDGESLAIGKKAAEAAVNRLVILSENQQKTVERYSKLAEENFVNRAMVDDQQAQLQALRQQLASANASLAQVDSDIAKTTVTSPATGRIEKRLVDVGDFVGVGKPVFRVASADLLRVVLPFPETVADTLSIGQKVELSSPSAPQVKVHGSVAEIRPMISADARAVEMIMDVPNPGGWKPGGTVKGIVTQEERKSAVLVPETCVVLRPAGAVVYVIESGIAHQRIVKTGVKKEGLVEIISGVKDGETLAQDGAAYLTDKAPVSALETE